MQESAVPSTTQWQFDPDTHQLTLTRGADRLTGLSSYVQLEDERIVRTEGLPLQELRDGPEQAEIRFRCEDPSLTVALSLARCDSGGVDLRLFAVNEGSAPLRVAKLGVVTAQGEGALKIPGPVSKWCFFKNGRHKNDVAGCFCWEWGTQVQSELMSTSSEEGSGYISHPWTTERIKLISEYVMAIQSAQRGRGVLLGFVTQRDQFGRISFRSLPGEGEVSLTCDSMADGVTIAPGERLESETLRIAFTDRLLDAIDDWAAAVAAANHPRKPKRTYVGWCSWYFYRKSVTEAHLLKDLEEARRNNIPLDHFLIDAGWRDRKSEDPTRNTFPGGMKVLRERISAQGAIPGIWWGPFTGRPRRGNSPPEFFFRNPDGSIRCWEEEPALCPIDATHPGVQEHLRNRTHQFVHEWGYRMIKLDLLRILTLPGLRYHQNVTRAQALRMGLQAIREAAGDDVLLLCCGGPYGPTLGLADINRSGVDTGGTWERFYRGARLAAARYFMQGRWWLNDPDCVQLRQNREPVPGIRRSESEFTDAEILSQLTLAHIATQFISDSDALPLLDGEKQRLLRLAAPGGAPRTVRALDLFDRPFPSLLVQHVDTPWVEGWNVGAINWDDEPLDLSISLPELGTDPTARYYIRELWTDSELGVFSADQRVALPTLPPHHSHLLAIRRLQAHPQLLATDLHLSQGVDEVDSCTFDGGVLRIELGACVEEGSIFAHIPAPFEIDRVEGGRGVKRCEQIAQIHTPGKGTVAIHLRKR